MKFGWNGGNERRVEIGTYGMTIPLFNFCILPIRFSTIAVVVKSEKPALKDETKMKMIFGDGYSLSRSSMCT